MKLHKDGTVEGTPEEIAEYNRLVNGTQALGPVGGQYRSPSDASNPLLPRDAIKPVITSGGCSIQSDGKGITARNEFTRDIVELQKDYWKENLAKSLEGMEKRTGFPKSEILLYAIKGTNLD